MQILLRRHLLRHRMIMSLIFHWQGLKSGLLPLLLLDFIAKQIVAVPFCDVNCLA